MKWFAAFVLGMVLFFSAPPGSGDDKGCFKILAEDDLVCREEYCPGVFDAGDGVGFRMAPGSRSANASGPGDVDEHHRARRRQAGAGPARFVLHRLRPPRAGRRPVLDDRRVHGGHDCCARYHFFSRPAPEQTLRYLGATAGSAQGIDEAPFLCRSGILYLEDWDTRFLYFHTPYSQSLLLFPTHYQVTSSGLAIDNLPFRNKYLQQMRGVEADMAAAPSNRASRPSALLLGKDRGRVLLR